MPMTFKSVATVTFGTGIINNILLLLLFQPFGTQYIIFLYFLASVVKISLVKNIS